METVRSSRKSGTNLQLYALSDGLLEFMEGELDALLRESNARCGLVIDRTGCILASAGDFHPINPDTMGATAAATIAALNTMVSRASSPEVSVRFFGAEIDKIHFVLLGERLILCLLHGKEANAGPIRSAVRKFLTAVTPKLEEAKRGRQKGSETVVESVSYIETKLDQLFKDQG